MNLSTSLLWGVAMLATSLLAAQPCHTSLVSPASMSLLYVDSEDGTHVASRLLDGDSTTYFRTRGNAPFPHEIIIDLGASLQVNQLSIQPRVDLPNGKLAAYEIYISDDTSNWGTPQARNRLFYTAFEDIAWKNMAFGAVRGRYVRLVALSNEDPSNMYRWLASGLQVYQDSCATITQQNQVISSPFSSRYSLTTAPLPLVATASSGLPVSYEIISGPAMISGNELSFTGAGTVLLKMSQTGDAQYYETTLWQQITVLDPADSPPALFTNVHGTTPMEMNTLKVIPIYARADVPNSDVFALDSISFDINGRQYPAEVEGNTYYVNWLPDQFGVHQVTIRAVTTDGIDSSQTYVFLLTNPIGDRTSRTFDGEVIEFGGQNSRWLYGTFELPLSVGVYDSIHADFWTSCPNNNCDDWDRLAWIEVQNPQGEWVEFLRYITPYGRGCDHDIKLTDYASLLNGRVNFRMFIDTWGTGGWGIHLNIHYFEGAPQHDYSQVDVIWKASYPFGNYANLQPVPAANVPFRSDAETVELQLVTTGHGWGANNTDNASEFRHSYNYLYANQVDTFVQDLWADCSPNPDGCQPQAGTYTFDRAGWCPGAIANLYTYDMNAYKANGEVNLQYIFDTTYVDLCHANHPDCITGVTCSNCNDGYNPVFQVSANLITTFDSLIPTQPLKVVSNDGFIPLENTFKLIPNPASKEVRVVWNLGEGAGSVDFLDIKGQSHISYQFDQVAELRQHWFSLEELPTGMYVVKLRVNDRSYVQRLIKE